MERPLDTRDLRFFLTVGESLHFKRAAERLGVAQPHLSLHIRQLEERLRAKLLERTTRSVKLTAAGEELLQRSRYILSQIDEAVAATRRAEGQPDQLKIGFTPAAAYGVLPWILGEFRRLHPDVGITLSQSGTAAQVQELVEGRLHFGFLRLPVHSRRLSTLSLAREGFVAALPRTHPMARRSAMRLEDLANERFIRFGPVAGVDFQEHILSYCHRAGFAPQTAVEAADTNAIIALVAAGFGVSILPEYMRKMSHPKVAFKQLREIPPLFDLAVAWVTVDPSPIRRHFREIIDKYLRAHPPK